MPVPTSYLTSVKNADAMFQAIKAAQAPDRFSHRFLEGLGFKSKQDRLIMPVLKSLGFLQDNGAPTRRYFEFLDQTQSGRVLAEAIQEAYADLFQVNRRAYDLSKSEIQNKLKTITEGKYGESAIEKMAATFKKLSSLADWKALESLPGPKEADEEKKEPEKGAIPAPQVTEAVTGKPIQLTYNIQIQLPESRDPAVYDALFRSLKEHLLK